MNIPLLFGNLNAITHLFIPSTIISHSGKFLLKARSAVLNITGNNRNIHRILPKFFILNAFCVCSTRHTTSADTKLNSTGSSYLTPITNHPALPLTSKSILPLISPIFVTDKNHPNQKPQVFLCSFSFLLLFSNQSSGTFNSSPDCISFFLPTYLLLVLN